jgi:hypothetical protein
MAIIGSTLFSFAALVFFLRTLYHLVGTVYIIINCNTTALKSDHHRHLVLLFSVILK